MQIGPFLLSSPWILAPMAGASQPPYRRLVREMGAGAAPTELVSAKGILHENRRTLRYLAHDAREEPFWVQLFGGEPATMAAAAERAVEHGAKIIDVNMGCPVRKVTRSGAGSALLCEPERAARIVEAISARTGVPVTAKIRSGWDRVNAIDMVRVLQQAGCAVVALHARTCKQGFSGRADWGVIAQAVAAASIPVIGNGDVRTAEDARRMQRETGCQGVMIGRGALGNPWIFKMGTQAPPTPEERWAVVRRHMKAHVEFIGSQEAAVRSFRQHLIWYAHGLRGATAFRRHVCSLDDLSEVLAACASFFTALQNRSPSVSAGL